MHTRDNNLDTSDNQLDNMEPHESKKKPGRPKKKVSAAVDKCLGVVDKPTNERNLVELMYRDSTLFKKIISLLHSYNVSIVEITFDTNFVSFEGSVPSKLRIIATINASEMTQYYCKTPTQVCIKCDALDLILGTAAKLSTIQFSLQDDTRRSTLYCCLSDVEYKCDDLFDIEIIMRADKDEVRRTFDDTNYPVKLQLGSKHFKALCNNMSKFADKFCIQHVGGGRLQLKFGQPRKGGIKIYNNNEKIGLNSAIDQEDILSVTMCVSVIEPFSKSCFGDTVVLSVDKQQPMSFLAHFTSDSGKPVASVKLFAELKDYVG